MRRSTARATVVAIACALGLVACSPGEPPERSERERDSLIGQSALPGARGVQGALRAQDSARARAARADSIGRSP